MRIKSIEVMPHLEEVWRQALKVHRTTWETIGQWGNHEKDTSQVISAIKPEVLIIRALLREAERILTIKYELTQGDLFQLQRETEKKYSGVFTPIPVTGQYKSVLNEDHQ
jgi:hypothetical protein